MTSPDPTLPTSKTPPAIMDMVDLKAEIQAQLPVADEPVENPGLNWLRLMGLEIGDEITVLPMALPGQQFGGKLVDMAVGPEGPLVIFLKQTEDKPVNTIPWHGVQLIAKALAPAVEVPQPTVDLTELENFMRENGLDVPESVTEYIHGQEEV